MQASRLVVIGKVAKPFGIRGEIKVQAFTSTPAPFARSARLYLDDEEFTVAAARPHKGSVLLTLDSVDTPERVRALVGRLVRTDRANFPPVGDDEYYLHELLGMKVVCRHDGVLGHVTNIIETGANDVLEIHGPRGEILLPHIEGVVLDVNFDAEMIRVDPPEGLVPDA